MIMRPGSGDLFIWRLDPEEFGATWDSGIGAEKVGGRWNSKGVRVVYGSLDSSTAILEVAVHKGFESLDTVRMMLTCARITDLSSVFTIDDQSVPNPNWLFPGTPSGGQQQFGDALLTQHPFLLVPSSVNPHSWNLLMNPELATGKYELVLQERLRLDTRLNPPWPLMSSTRHG
ncbi:RES domain-containing protein [Pseudomonas sp. WS 5011]|uniref:RES family NAD+ phosphorylase n=1 Tax=Pseudomonas sp. WS 5011 TaxID=2717477 RepID=UPI0014748948|nr:RES domain-containing protein [Pseudomonas sp. WS 5011]NMY53176.1 RES domain-containing protein [Pseudomonas sp. WS 5011]|tara:strand:+ start:808 stop:1329 length:522 start_codon:yes stop_codon:yes gene_type:complete